MNRNYLILALLMMSQPAHAYVDPGSGMLAIQGIIALAVAIISFVTHPIQTIKNWWRRIFRKEKDDA